MSQTLFSFHRGTVKPLRFNYSQCPVCGSRVKDDHLCVSEGVLCESDEECLNGCYYRRFSYGFTDTGITVRGHHVVFYGSYSDGPQECRDRSDAIDMVVACAQACLLEDYWKGAPTLQSETLDARPEIGS